MKTPHIKITIEGPQGCGKTLLRNALQGVLSTNGLKKVYIQELREEPRLAVDRIAVSDTWEALANLRNRRQIPILIHEK